MKSVEDYCHLIGQYQLLSPDDLASMKARWYRPDRTSAADAGQFRKWLVLNHYLSDFVLGVLDGDHPEFLVLNQYRLHDQCKTAGFAGSYLATDQEQRPVAIQILAAGAVADSTARQEIVDTTRKLMALRHPNVARTLDIGQAHGLYFIASRYYEGTTLGEIQKRRGKLPYLSAARLMTLALEGLAALHSQGLSGGDLTADCILLTPAGKGAPGEFTVKLLNPGLKGRVFDSKALAQSQSNPHELCLADSAMFPQVSIGGPKPSEDLFRLGTVFYHTVTGREPFPPGHSAGTGQAAPPISESVPDVPEALAEIIESVIAPDPAERPRAAAHVAKSLRVFLATEESARPAEVEHHIVPRARHELAREADDEESMEPDDDRPRRRWRSAPTGSFAQRVSDLWDEYGPTDRDLIYFTLGPVTFALIILVVNLFTGLSVANVLWLLSGMCIAYAIDRILKWNRRKKRLKAKR
jgi:serine/threonine protein kinase